LLEVEGKNGFFSKKDIKELMEEFLKVTANAIEEKRKSLK
jgi:hypothetical protein